MRKRRRLAATEDEKLDRWLISYADFITLLFAFFVVLYAISTINEGRYRQVTESLTAAFDVTPKSMEPIQVGDINREINDRIIELPVKRPPGTENLKEMADAIEKEMLALLPKDDITIRRSKQWLEIELNSEILFSSGSSNLTQNSRFLLSKVADILANFPNPINVEGFTDNQPISTAQFPSNWELSAGRAASVVHLFSRLGIEPGRMAAIAYGEHRPIASNDTAEGRRKNRRVVIAVLAGDMNVKTQRQQQNAE
ncbi:MAG: flagellar motor protein MotD [Gammaproteobacteria bacterium]|nr:flagellar motor protein MotD [Gammaproteobacteria bacterium]